MCECYNNNPYIQYNPYNQPYGPFPSPQNPYSDPYYYKPYQYNSYPNQYNLYSPYQNYNVTWTMQPIPILVPNRNRILDTVNESIRGPINMQDYWKYCSDYQLKHKCFSSENGCVCECEPNDRHCRITPNSKGSIKRCPY